MKNILLMLVCLCGFSISNAQSAFTIQGSWGGQAYRSFDSALINAQPGDTLNLPGGTYNIGTVTIAKKLKMVGAGHYPDSTMATGATMLVGNIRYVTGSSESAIEGIYLNGNLNIGTNSGNGDVHGLDIIRCSLGSVFLAYSSSYISAANNVLINGCVIREGVNFNYANDVLLENSIVNNAISNSNGSVKVANNILIGYNVNLLNYISSTLFENNIFYQSSGFNYNSNSNTFKNNVFRLTTPLIGSDVGINNLFQVTNLFVNYSTGEFDYSHDFHLAAGSPAIGAGAGNTDCGIYGGPRAYKASAVPSNPHIQSSIIADNTDNNGKINIQVKVAAQQN